MTRGVSLDSGILLPRQARFASLFIPARTSPRQYLAAGRWVDTQAKETNTRRKPTFLQLKTAFISAWSAELKPNTGRYPRAAVKSLRDACSASPASSHLYVSACLLLLTPLRGHAVFHCAPSEVSSGLSRQSESFEFHPEPCFD